MSLVLSAVASDPCDPNNHFTFPLYLGERNERCKAAATGPLQCDRFLIPNWYVTPDAYLLNTCPSSGDCGVSYPAWMDGNLYFFLDCICLFIRIVKNNEKVSTSIVHMVRNGKCRKQYCNKECIRGLALNVRFNVRFYPNKMHYLKMSETYYIWYACICCWELFTS